MSFTQVITRSNKKSQIKIKPYFDPTVSNMGLEDYGITMFDGVKHMEQLLLDLMNLHLQLNY